MNYKWQVPGPLDEKGKPTMVRNPMPAPDALLIWGRNDKDLRIYRVDQNGAFRSRGISFKRLDLLSAKHVPKLLQSRRLTDRSKYPATDRGMRRILEERNRERV